MYKIYFLIIFIFFAVPNQSTFPNQFKLRVGSSVYVQGQEYIILKTIVYKPDAALYSCINASNKEFAVIKHGSLHYEIKMLNEIRERYEKRTKSKIEHSSIPYGIIDKPMDRENQPISNYDIIIMPHYAMHLWELFDYIKDNQSEFTFDDLCYFMFEMYKLLKKLHKTDIVNNDIKPDNLMLGIMGDPNSYRKLSMIDAGSSAYKGKLDKSVVLHFNSVFSHPGFLLHKDISVKNDYHGSLITDYILFGGEPKWESERNHNKKLAAEIVKFPTDIIETLAKHPKNNARFHKTYELLFEIYVELNKPNLPEKYLSRALKGILMRKCPKQPKLTYQTLFDDLHESKYFQLIKAKERYFKSHGTTSGNPGPSNSAHRHNSAPVH